MSRQEFPTKVKVAAFQRANKRCEHCTKLLYPGDIHYDHINPDGLTGEPTLGNCQVLCRACHSAKTKVDVTAISRSKRREAAHIGARAPSRNPLPFGRQSALKKRMDGSVVPRNRNG